MKKALLTLLQYVIFLGLGVAIAYYTYNKLSPKDKDDMMLAIRHTRKWMFAMVLIAGFFSHYFRALRWRLMLKPLDIHPSKTNTTLAVLIGYLVNLGVPRAGEVAKCTVLAKYENVPADKMIGTIVSERIFDVLCLGIITLITFFLQTHIIVKYVNDHIDLVMAKKNYLIAAFAAMALIVALVVVSYRRNKGSKIGKFITGLGNGLRSILILKDRWQFIGYTLLIWGLYTLQIQIAFWSMAATDGYGIQPDLLVLVFGSVGMILTQGGVGAYPALIALVLGLYGLEAGQGNAFGWVSWLGQTGIVVVLGLVSLILLPAYNRRKHNAQTAVDRK